MFFIVSPLTIQRCNAEKLGNMDNSSKYMDNGNNIRMIDAIEFLNPELNGSDFVRLEATFLRLKLIL